VELAQGPLKYKRGVNERYSCVY